MYEKKSSKIPKVIRSRKSENDCHFQIYGFWLPLVSSNSFFHTCNFEVRAIGVYSHFQIYGFWLPLVSSNSFFHTCNFEVRAIGVYSHFQAVHRLRTYNRKGTNSDVQNITQKMERLNNTNLTKTRGELRYLCFTSHSWHSVYI
jgi:hypothetical protein